MNISELIDVNTVIITSINFLIFVYLLNRFVIKKLNLTLSQRQKEISESIAFAEEMEEQKAKIKAEKNKMLGLAKKEANLIIEAAITEAASIKEDKQDELSKKLDHEMAEFEKKLKTREEEFEKKLNQQAVSLVTNATSKLLEEKLNEKEHDELIRDYIQEYKEKANSK